MDGQSGYCGQNLILHFGFGNAAVISSIKVEWQSGTDQVFTNVPVNQNVNITENGTIISIEENNSIQKNF
ncbi:MAG: ASPIC/UnbV domain-containing protein [Ignavibacteria bacterium]